MYSASSHQFIHNLVNHVDNSKFNKNKNRTLLLDFDGVIFRNQKALQLIKDRAVKFIAKKMTISEEKAETVNTELYSHYGHTVIGLNKVFDPCITMKEFNDYLYNDDLFNDIMKMNYTVDYSNAKFDGIDARRLVNYTRGECIGTFVFTNAPVRWVEFALNNICIGNLFMNQEIISAEDFDYVKPQKNIYTDVQSDLGNDCKITFVDDSIVNIKSAPSSWNNILFTPDLTRVNVTKSDEVYLTVNSLDKLITFEKELIA